MASGKVHAISTTILAVASVPILVASAVNIGHETLLVLPGILIGILVTPDLDIDHRIVSHRYMRNVFGKVAGYYWYYLWHSYSIALRHRSAWSHTPIIGTLLRLTFILFPFIIVPFRNQQTSFPKFAFYLVISTFLVLPFWGVLYLLIITLQVNIIFVLFVVLGLMLADALHYIMDNI